METRRGEFHPISARPGRAALRVICERLAEATADREHKQAEYDNLSRPAHVLEAAVAHHAAEKAAYDALLVS
jgi:hypothetical protein